VLLVEGDPLVQAQVEPLLRQRNHRVTACASAATARVAFAAAASAGSPYPLVLVAWSLPDNSGLDLCRMLRASEPDLSTHFMLLNTPDQVAELALPLATVASDCLTAPLDPRLLKLRLVVAEEQIRGAAARERAAQLERDRHDVLELIARNQPLEVILSRLTELVERHGNGLRCGLLLARQGGAPLAIPADLPELADVFLDALVHYWGGLPGGPPAPVQLSDHFSRGSSGASLGPSPREGLEIGASETARDFPLDGTRSWALPICGADGRPTGTVVVVRDEPGPLRVHERALLTEAARLATFALEHTSLVDQAAAAEALRALAGLKSEFLSTASHELRTPLSLVFGYSELLQDRATQLSPDQVTDMAREIQSASRTMIRLVDDLLDYARIEQGQLRLERRWTDVADFLRDLVGGFQARPGGSRIGLRLPERLEARLDPERLAQVVGNLLSNALRYAPDGPIVLWAGLAEGRVEIAVEDVGPGIPPEEQSRVWERFYRGSDAIASPIRGSGLGLAVVKHLVELQNGQVGLRSRPGQGSIFWISLPVDGGE
jgi:signal transduction histidine kinase/DNA-binding response OmpR family regulator